MKNTNFHFSFSNITLTQNVHGFYKRIVSGVFAYTQKLQKYFSRFLSLILLTKKKVSKYFSAFPICLIELKYKKVNKMFFCSNNSFFWYSIDSRENKNIKTYNIFGFLKYFQRSFFNSKMFRAYNKKSELVTRKSFVLIIKPS